jgi:MFS family permease
MRFLVVFALGIAGAAAAPNVWIGTLAMVLSGFGNGGAIVANITLVQRGAPDRVRGRAFTLLMSANFAVFGVSLIVAGPVTDAVGARWVYAGAAGTILVAALTAWRLARGVETHPRTLAEPA